MEEGGQIMSGEELGGRTRVGLCSRSTGRHPAGRHAPSTEALRNDVDRRVHRPPQLLLHDRPRRIGLRGRQIGVGRRRRRAGGCQRIAAREFAFDDVRPQCRVVLAFDGAVCPAADTTSRAARQVDRPAL
jgi:hypothetical protein